MKVVIHNLYGINDGSKAYFRKQAERGRKNDAGNA